jgi:hypothetical protein
MPGVGDVPKEGMAALQAELAGAGDVEFPRTKYSASMSERAVTC